MATTKKETAQPTIPPTFATASNYNLQPKEVFNALSNAIHIFAFKEDATPFVLLQLIPADKGCKAVVMLEDGSIEGLFTDSESAGAAFNELNTVFGKEQPPVVVKMKVTAKGASVYYLEVV